MQIFTAKTRQCETTTRYPQAVEVNGLQDLLAAAQHDQIFSKMKDNRRSTENFLQTDCLVLDLDNTHSEDPNDWKSIDDIADAFPEVHFYYVQSRNYMKPKKKGNKVQEPREKYHVYFPLSRPITKRAGAKTALDAACIIAAKFHDIPIDLAHPDKAPGLLDVGAAKPEQPMYGVEDPQGGEITGELCLDEYLRQPDVKAIWKPALAADKKQEQTDAQEDLRPVGLEWVDEAEQRRSAEWFEEWAQKHGAGLGKRYGINQGNHKDAVAYPVRCPWEDDHTEYGGPLESVVIVDRTGKLNYLCRHAHCAGHTWASYRQRVEELADFAPLANLPEDQTAEGVKKALEDYRQEAAGCNIGAFLESKECNTPPIATGWPTLDRFLGGGLFPGLHTLGAVPSLGKTSFALQLADELSARGQDVLFFSFEMSAMELKAKSISRITAQLEASRLGKTVGGLFVSQAANTGALEHAKNAREIMNPERRREYSAEDWALVNEAIKVYGNRARHLWIIEGDKDGRPLSAAEVAQCIANHKAKTGHTPVVFVDYLQKMKTPDPHYTDLQRIDENISGLRGAAKVYSCPVIAILSYNRAGYYGTVDITSGKGSGDIEYSSDVQLGMQPVGMEEGESAKAGNKALIHQTKRQPVRNLELLITKQRMDVTDKSVTFSYAAEYNTFEETGEGDGIVNTRKKRSTASRETNERKTAALEKIAAVLEAQEARASLDDF